ncbi:MAG: hypothetical protein ACTSU4_02815 [Promethearchaeota archaeon]
MSGNSEVKLEKTQIKGIIEKDKVIIYDKKGIDEFYKNFYIGTLEQRDKSK